MTDWNGKRVTILGLGKTGHASALYLARRHAEVLVSESAQLKGANLKYAEDLTQQGVEMETGGHSDQSLTRAELILTSPGIPPDADVIKRALAQGKPVVSDVELAFRESTVPVVAITGTNGKSTTTALISFILEYNGLKAPACGNFGVPVLAALETSPDYVVVETSSYQLYYCDQLAPLVAVWLNLTPDHLDWHHGLDNYILAKKSVFQRQRSDQFAVLNMDDPIVAATETSARVFPFSVAGRISDTSDGAFIKDARICYRYLGRTQVVCAVDELQIIGQHNLENALAAISVAVILGLEQAQIALGLKNFGGLEHRLEYVDTVAGVRCYNDSKATNTDSTIKALLSFKEKIVLIAGGRDKGTDLAEFADCARSHTQAVILLGEAKERFAKALEEAKVENIHFVGSLEEAVELGLKMKAGPLVLSPACASYDMFKDFEDRGRVFKELIRARSKKTAATKS